MTDDGTPDGGGSVTLRFLAAPTDVALLGGTGVAGGRVLEWVDKAAYACAVAWGGGYCVTAYVGNVHFRRPIHSGDLVEVTAQLVLTGRSSMHVQVTVRAAPVATRVFTETTSCLVVFVAVGPDGRPSPVRPWTPPTPALALAEQDARARVDVRRSIEEAMAAQTYTGDSQAPASVMRFLAAPTDVNWGGKTHGGTVMRWIDDAAWACAVGWSGTDARSVFSGGIRFYRPIPIGNLVEVRARLLHTGRTSMHLSVHVLTADPKVGEYALTTHSLTVFVALDGGRPVPTPSWVPQAEEDRRLDAHAVHLMGLRRS
ncbi:MAG: acyl-CoA thioesterase [Actinobacteria bacterium]|nr:acyl-CoA thioesterase [Actinomycetota bacterium]